MDHRTKGFTLIELLIALAVFLILITLAVPAFTRSVQTTRADTEIGGLAAWTQFRPTGGHQPWHHHSGPPDSRWQRLDR